MLTIVIAIVAFFSPEFRTTYVRAIPVLKTMSYLLGAVIAAFWIIGFIYMGFSSPTTLTSPILYLCVAASILYTGTLLWVDGPVLIMGTLYAYRFFAKHWGVISKSAFAFFALSFVTLSYLAMKLSGESNDASGHPTELKCSQWSIRDTVIRGGAIVSALAVLLLLLAMMLPRMLNFLEGRGFAPFVAARHVRAEKSSFLTVISILSICGVAVSSCTLSNVVSVMGGFSQDLKRKILGNNAHLVVDQTSQAPWGDYDSVLERLRAQPGVIAATPVVHGEVMMSSSSNLAGVIVRGVDPSSIRSVIDLGTNIEIGKFEYLEHPNLLLHLPPSEVIGIGPGCERYLKGVDTPFMTDDLDPLVKDSLQTSTHPERPGIIVGRELAKTLHVYVGDEVTLVSPLGDLGPMGVMPKTKKFRIAAIFFSGMYEYDATHAYALIDVAQDYFGMPGKITAIDVKVEDAERADQQTPLLQAAIERPELRVRDWREMNKNLFSALKLERIATFVILSIAILVASFCIICTLLLMVTEKGKEIAILKAVGASDGSILKTFFYEGVIIGAIGTVFGVLSGLAVCLGLKWIGLRLDPDVYYIDRLPISVNGWDFVTVAAAALGICSVMTILPAFAASTLRPVDGLRYE